MREIKSEPLSYLKSLVDNSPYVNPSNHSQVLFALQCSRKNHAEYWNARYRGDNLDQFNEFCKNLRKLVGEDVYDIVDSIVEEIDIENDWKEEVARSVESYDHPIFETESWDL